MLLFFVIAPLTLAFLVAFVAFAVGAGVVFKLGLLLAAALVGVSAMSALLGLPIRQD